MSAVLDLTTTSSSSAVSRRRLLQRNFLFFTDLRFIIMPRLRHMHVAAAAFAVSRHRGLLPFLLPGFPLSTCLDSHCTGCDFCAPVSPPPHPSLPPPSPPSPPVPPFSPMTEQGFNESCANFVTYEVLAENLLRKDGGYYRTNEKHGSHNWPAYWMPPPSKYGIGNYDQFDIDSYDGYLNRIAKCVGSTTLATDDRPTTPEEKWCDEAGAFPCDNNCAEPDCFMEDGKCCYATSEVTDEKIKNCTIEAVNSLCYHMELESKNITHADNYRTPCGCATRHSEFLTARYPPDDATLSAQVSPRNARTRHGSHHAQRHILR